MPPSPLSFYLSLCRTLKKRLPPNGFSKKRINHAAAVCLHFAHYNLVRNHTDVAHDASVKHGIVDHLVDAAVKFKLVFMGLAHSDG